MAIAASSPDGSSNAYSNSQSVSESPSCSPATLSTPFSIATVSGPMVMVWLSEPKVSAVSAVMIFVVLASASSALASCENNTCPVVGSNRYPAVAAMVGGGLANRPCADMVDVTDVESPAGSVAGAFMSGVFTPGESDWPPEGQVAASSDASVRAGATAIGARTSGRRVVAIWVVGAGARPTKAHAPEPYPASAISATTSMTATSEIACFQLRMLRARTRRQSTRAIALSLTIIGC